MAQQYRLKGWSIVVGGSEGEKLALCLLSVNELLNLEPLCLFVLFWSTAQQLFGGAGSWQQQIDG